MNKMFKRCINQNKHEQEKKIINQLMVHLPDVMAVL